MRKLGNRKASYNPKRLFLAKYINRSTISTTALPVDMSVSPMIQANPWIMNGMLMNGPDPAAAPVLVSTFGLSQTAANDLAAGGLGDCWWACAARRSAIAAASVGKLVYTSYADMVKSALMGYTSTGWNPKDSANTDQGTDPTQGFAYVKSTGLWTSDGTYNKQMAQLSVDPKDFEAVTIAFNIGMGLSVGINFPQDYESATVWDVTSSPIVGGHEICGFSNLAVKPAGIEIDSWGQIITFTAAGLAQQCTDLFAIIDPDQFGPGSTAINGFDSEQMLADLQAA
jgi:hypothetical protein